MSCVGRSIYKAGLEEKGAFVRNESQGGLEKKKGAPSSSQGNQEKRLPQNSVAGEDSGVQE